MQKVTKADLMEQIRCLNMKVQLLTEINNDLQAAAHRAAEDRFSRFTAYTSNDDDDHILWPSDMEDDDDE